MTVTEKHHKLAFWSMIDDHSAKYHIRCKQFPIIDLGWKNISWSFVIQKYVSASQQGTKVSAVVFDNRYKQLLSTWDQFTKRIFLVFFTKWFWWIWIFLVLFTKNNSTLHFQKNVKIKMKNSILFYSSIFYFNRI